MKLLRYFPHLIKSFRFCLSYFPLTKAWRLPVLVHRKVVCRQLKGQIIVDTLRTGLVKIGFPGTEISSSSDTTVINFFPDSRIMFRGPAVIGSGSRLSIRGKCSFGRNFIVSMDSKIVCENEIIFGDDVLISWSTQILDSDQHELVIDKHTSFSKSGRIEIGNCVWVGSRSTILKDTVVSDHSVIATHTLVNSVFKDKSVLIAGVPGKVIRENISWRY